VTEILHSGRTVTKHVVAFDIKWDGDLEGRSVLWWVAISSADGEEGVQLGYETVGGEFSAQFVKDLATGREAEVDQDADLTGHELTVRFPPERVGIAMEWPMWRAGITIDGVQVAEQVMAPP
jgi:hypothetical protein